MQNEVKSYTVIVRDIKHGKGLIRRKTFSPTDYHDATQYANMVRENYKGVYSVEFKTNFKKKSCIIN